MISIRQIKIPLRRQVRRRSRHLLPPHRSKQTKIDCRIARGHWRLPRIPRHQHPCRRRHRVISRQVRRRSRTIGVKRNRISRSARRSRRQTLIPNIPPLEQNRISRLKRLRIHVPNRLPRGRCGSPVTRVAPRARTHVVSRRRCQAAPYQKHEDDDFSRRPNPHRYHLGRSRPIGCANQLAATRTLSRACRTDSLPLHSLVSFVRNFHSISLPLDSLRQ